MESDGSINSEDPLTTERLRRGKRIPVSIQDNEVWSLELTIKQIEVSVLVYNHYVTKRVGLICEYKSWVFLTHFVKSNFLYFLRGHGFSSYKL